MANIFGAEQKVRVLPQTLVTGCLITFKAIHQTLHNGIFFLNLCMLGKNLDVFFNIIALHTCSIGLSLWLVCQCGIF